MWRLIGRKINILSKKREGCPYIIEGKVVDTIDDTPHGCYKVVTHQKDLIIDKTYKPKGKYIAYTYSLGSYATTGVWIYDLSKREFVYEYTPDERFEIYFVPADEIIIVKENYRIEGKKEQYQEEIYKYSRHRVYQSLIFLLITSTFSNIP